MTKKIKEELMGLLKVNSLFREANIDRFEIMNKVKEVKMLPGIDKMTIKMAAEYFETSESGILRYVQLLKNEFHNEEFCEYSYEDVKNMIIKSGISVSDYGGGFTFDFNDMPFMYSFSRNKFISRKGMLRLAMVLSRCPLARKIRELLVKDIAGESCEDDDSTDEKKAIVTPEIINQEEINMFKSSEHRNNVIKTLEDKTQEIKSFAKELDFIPGFEYATISMIANYYCVKSSIILDIYKKFPCEFKNNCMPCRPISNTIFDMKAIIRFAMFLKYSEPAHLIRVEMINYLYNSDYKISQSKTVEPKVEIPKLPEVEIDSIEAKIGKAFLNGTANELETLLNQVCSEIDNEITKKEKENALLSEQNEYLAKILENIRGLQAVTA